MSEELDLAILICGTLIILVVTVAVIWADLSFRTAKLRYADRAKP